MVHINILSKYQAGRKVEQSDLHEILIKPSDTLWKAQFGPN